MREPTREELWDRTHAALHPRKRLLPIVVTVAAWIAFVMFVCSGLLP